VWIYIILQTDRQISGEDYSFYLLDEFQSSNDQRKNNPTHMQHHLLPAYDGICARVHIASMDINRVHYSGAYLLISTVLHCIYVKEAYQDAGSIHRE